MRVVRCKPGRSPRWVYRLQLETAWRTLRLREAIDADDIQRHGRDLAEALGSPLRDESGG